MFLKGPRAMLIWGQSTQVSVIIEEYEEGAPGWLRWLIICLWIGS